MGTSPIVLIAMIYFILFFILFATQYEKLQIMIGKVEKEVARRPNINYGSLWEAGPPWTTG